MEEGLTNKLKRVNFLFKNQEISTECVKSYRRFTIFGKNFGPFEAGKKYRLPFFVAIDFIEQNILKVISSERCDNKDVQRYAISERDDRRLKDWPDKFFLNRIMEFKRFTEKEINEKQRPGIDLDRFKSYMAHIIDGRLTKLIKLSRTDLTLNDEKRLTASEVYIYQKINNIINEWRKFFLNDT